MKKLFLLLIPLMMMGCCRRSNLRESTHYFDEKVIIVSKSPKELWVSGKHSGESRYLLVRRATDTTMYAELNGNWLDKDGRPHNWTNPNYFDSLCYNTDINDTLFFDYILKSRFFHIYNFEEKYRKND